MAAVRKVARVKSGRLAYPEVIDGSLQSDGFTCQGRVACQYAANETLATGLHVDGAATGSLGPEPQVANVKGIQVSSNHERLKTGSASTDIREPRRRLRTYREVLVSIEPDGCQHGKNGGRNHQLYQAKAPQAQEAGLLKRRSPPEAGFWMLMKISNCHTNSV